MRNPFAAPDRATPVPPSGRPEPSHTSPNGPPYRPVTAFTMEQQAFIRHLAETGEIALAEQDGVPHVSYWALEPYLLATDPSDWDPNWASA